MLKYFVDIAKKLNTLGVKPMPLKGLSFNIDTYSNIGVRYSCDIDILVDRKEIPSCIKVLKDCGYYELENTKKGIRTNFGQALVFRNKESIFVDLHYRLLPWYEEKYIYKINSEDILRRAEEIDFRGCRIRMMNKNDQILYTAVLCAREGYSSFKYYMDIDTIVRMHESLIDWEYIYKKSESMQFRKKLIRIFSFLTYRAGIPMPFTKNIKASKKTLNMDFFTGKSKFNNKVFNFFQAPSIKDKTSLIVLYFKWQCLKRFGLFRDYFKIKNGV